MNMIGKIATGIVALVITGGAYAGVAAISATKLSEDALAVKGHSRITVSGRELKKDQTKRSGRCTVFYRREIKTARLMEVKIRNTGTDATDYTVEYYFISHTFGDNNKLAIFDRGTKTVNCEAGKNVNIEVKSRELTAVERRDTSSSDKSHSGNEVDGYFVRVLYKGEEIMTFNSKQGEKYEQTVRDLIANKKDLKEEKVKVTNSIDD